MASLSRSVWFSTFLIFLFLWNILHNSDTLAPPAIEVVDVVYQEDTTAEVDDPGLYPDPPQPELYEPDLPSDWTTGGEEYFYAKPPSNGQTVNPASPTADIINPPAATDGVLGADGNAVSSLSLDRPLILYTYTETPEARVNLRFFIKHGLHSTSDFVFILNGLTDANTLFASPLPTNIRIIQRDVECHDLAAATQVLLEQNEELANKYKKFIIMNAKIRGPFLPSWSKQCWTGAYLSKLSDAIKLVGMSYDCFKGRNRLQPYLWATDLEGLNTISTVDGISECSQSLEAALLAETRALSAITEKGYQIDVLAQPESIISASSKNLKGTVDAESDPSKLEFASTAQVSSATFSNHEPKESDDGFQTTNPGITAAQYDNIEDGFGNPDILNAESSNSDKKVEAAVSRPNLDDFDTPEGSHNGITHSAMPSEPANLIGGSGSNAFGSEENFDVTATDGITDAKTFGDLPASGEKPFGTTHQLHPIQEGSNSLAAGESIYGGEDLDLLQSNTNAAKTSPEDFEVAGNSAGLDGPTNNKAINDGTHLAGSDSVLESGAGSKQPLVAATSVSDEVSKDNELSHASDTQVDSTPSPELSHVDSNEDENPGEKASEAAFNEEDDISDEELAEENAKNAVNPAYLDPASIQNLGTSETLQVRKRDDLLTIELGSGSGECIGDYMVHPYATMFVRVDSVVENEAMQKLTNDHDARGLSAYEVCF